MRLLRVEWTSAYIKARARCFKPSSIESGFRKARARGSPSTPRALNLRQISDLVRNDGDIPTSARDP
jgi:hypothetical protein